MLGFFQFSVQLGEPAPVSDLGLIVEHLAGVAKTADMNACLFEILIGVRQATRRLAGVVLVALAGDSARQIEHVEFGRGMPQEVGEVAETLAVLQAEGFSVVADGPVLTLSGEDSFFLRRAGARSLVTATSRAMSSTPRLRCHLSFSRPFRAEFSGNRDRPNRTTGTSTSLTPVVRSFFTPSQSKERITIKAFQTALNVT
ncbi:MAG: hypothetical protein ABSD30_16910 [Candidatus Binatus sp.]